MSGADNVHCRQRCSEGGVLAFNAPIEITRSGRIVYESRLASLTPSGRELDFEAVCYSPSAVTR